MLIRPMTFTDIPACIEISKSARQETYQRLEKSFYPPELYQQEMALYSADTFSQFISEQNKLALVSEKENTLSGLAIGKFSGAGVFELAWICSKLDSQRQGIGTSLLEHIQNECRAKGSHKIIAYTFPWLPAVVAFYQKSGFIQEAVFPRHWHKLDFVLMSKQI